MEFELPKINVSFEYDEEKDEIVLVINGVEKRVKTADMITEMEKLQEQNTALEQEPCEDCISRKAVLEIAKSSKSNWIDNSVLFKRVNELPPVTPKPKTDVLDKIRAEIEHLTITEGGEDYVRTMAELYSLKIKVLQIIDKYRTEREDKE